MPKTQPYTTITRDQVGKRHSQLGRVLPGDVGKRVYVHEESGIEIVEYDQQFRERRKAEATRKNTPASERR